MRPDGDRGPRRDPEIWKPTEGTMYQLNEGLNEGQKGSNGGVIHSFMVKSSVRKKIKKK